MKIDCIWNRASHCGFPSLIRFGGKWFCSFREADSHMRHSLTQEKQKDGIVRIISSVDGVQWRSIATFAMDGYDLREAGFSITPAGKLMMMTCGRAFHDGQYQHLQSVVSFSNDGITWSPLQNAGPQDHWLWRVLWHEGYAYSWAYPMGVNSEVPADASISLLKSADAIHWEKIASGPPGSEAASFFDLKGRMFTLLRSENSLIGESAPPLDCWRWYRTGYFFGGPNWLPLSNGTVIGGGRLIHGGKPLTMLYRFDLERKACTPALVLPSGGDCSYPSFVETEGELWVAYYSSHEGTAKERGTRQQPWVSEYASHEGNTWIYLAKIPLEELESDISTDYPPALPVGILNHYQEAGRRI